MATYASRISSVLAPVTERVRRWSQGSTSEDASSPRLIPRSVPTGSSYNATDDTAISSSPDGTAVPFGSTPPHSPSRLRIMSTLRESQTTADDTIDSAAIVDDSPSTSPQVSRAQPIPTAPHSLGPVSDPETPSSPAQEPGSPELRRHVGPLPEDDGYRDLRQKLLDIRTSDLPERERAKRMHELMTEKWNQSRVASSPHSDPAKSPTLAPAATPDNPYKLLPGDDETTYYTGPGSEEDPDQLGCAHYKRNNKLQCATCERWHTCRFCHDEAEDHALVRQKTKNMLCMICKKPQPAGQDCRHCGTRTARYYCDKCKLWDDDPEKSIYHCNDCGICRIGKGLGKDFFHCKTCGVCMSIQLKDSHRCIERSTECDCPICGEYMFTSTLTVVFMACGHSIHHNCYREHMKSSYRCPTCARTIVNMETQFRALDDEIQNQPLPSPYDSWRAIVSCNDCYARTTAPFHFLGLKCQNCRGYNTAQIKILRPEEEGGGEGRNGEQQSPALVSVTPAVALGVGAVVGAGVGGGLAATSPGTVNGIADATEAAQEVLESLDRGDDDLLDDSGWVSEEEDDDDDDDDDDGDVLNWSDEEEEDDEDEEEDELINLIGHV